MESENIIQNIPEELRRLNQWVNWKPEIRDNKITKIPLNPHTLKNAMTNDPATWGRFEQAITNLNKQGIAGIGVVVTERDPFTGIDLDKCRNPETGEIEAWALRIIETISSYSEISPSGTGIRIFVKAKLPEGMRKKGRIEIYDSGRFFTVTGRVLNGD